MKKIVLSFAMMAAFGAFIASSYATSGVNSNSTILCDGGHECSDKCKKNKEGKCTEANAEGVKSSSDSKGSCCAKGEKSCHGDKKMKKSKKGKKENQDPKS